MGVDWKPCATRPRTAGTGIRRATACWAEIYKAPIDGPATSTPDAVSRRHPGPTCDLDLPASPPPCRRPGAAAAADLLPCLAAFTRQGPGRRRAPPPGRAPVAAVAFPVAVSPTCARPRCAPAAGLRRAAHPRRRRKAWPRMRTPWPRRLLGAGDHLVDTNIVLTGLQASALLDTRLLFLAIWAACDDKMHRPAPRATTGTRRGAFSASAPPTSRALTRRAQERLHAPEPHHQRHLLLRPPLRRRSHRPRLRRRPRSRPAAPSPPPRHRLPAALAAAASPHQARRRLATPECTALAAADAAAARPPPPSPPPAAALAASVAAASIHAALAAGPAAAALHRARRRPRRPCRRLRRRRRPRRHHPRHRRR